MDEISSYTAFPGLVPGTQTRCGIKLCYHRSVWALGTRPREAEKSAGLIRPKATQS
jgi:hypothetical protein